MSRSRNLGYGEGSIYQEDDTGRWRGELRIGVKRRRVSAWTRREVVEKLDELRSLNAAGLMMGNNIRVGEWFDWYDGVVISTKNKSNASSCRWALKHCGPLRGHRLSELEVEHVEDLFRELARVKPQLAKTKGRGGQKCTGLSKSSLFRVKMVLGAALYEAERRDKVRRNVARLAYLPAAPARKRVRRSLTAEHAVECSHPGHEGCRLAHLATIVAFGSCHNNTTHDALPSPALPGADSTVGTIKAPSRPGISKLPSPQLDWFWLRPTFPFAQR